MGIEEDRNEFNTTGLRGLLRKAMAASDEAFVKVLEGGHQGELVNEKPSEGSGRIFTTSAGKVYSSIETPFLETSTGSCSESRCSSHSASRHPATPNHSFENRRCSSAA